MVKKFLMVAAFAALFITPARADEGMWLLPYLQKLNAASMKEQGLKIDVESIYSEKNSSLKDAIVIFGGGCTGELISAEGLILTNHHCGYGAIQQHSTVENDYLKDGFWAYTQEEEIPTPGLGVTFIKSIEDVTSEILPKLNDQMSEEERREAVAKLSEKIVKGADTKKYPGSSAVVKDYFGGNQYMLIVTQRFNDVRMVGAPPSSIGKFGGDTDNWMWPRHTGDFSLFRVYADKDGNPAAYSPDNVPLKPAKHLTISLAGVEKDDFTMVMGFPGSTNRYMSSYEIDEVLTQTNPNRIKIRGERQEILLADMKADPKIQIQYASKYMGSSNYWKNSIGMNRGLLRLNVKAEKEALEARFSEWVNSNDERKAKYGDALELKKRSIEGRMPASNVRQYISEALQKGTEIFSLASSFNDYAKELAKKESGEKSKFEEKEEQVKGRVEAFYKNYSPSTDLKAAKQMFKTFVKDIDSADYPEFMSSLAGKSDAEVEAFVQDLYDNSVLTSMAKIEAFLASPSSDKILNDPAVVAQKSINEAAKRLDEELKSYNDDFSRGHRKFIAGVLEMDSDKSFYPDANFTIRLTYGNILPYKAADAVQYDYITTLEGVMEKEDPNNPYEFTVPAKLKELYKDKDYGQYAAKDGDLVVCFISNNDITGGNSGSPVMNGNGELVGTAFDGNWEAMSGDIAFEPALQRCIAVDIRYTLFIIDKYAGATRLIDEMTIVK